MYMCICANNVQILGFGGVGGLGVGGGGYHWGGGVGVRGPGSYIYIYPLIVTVIVVSQLIRPAFLLRLGHRMRFPVL